MSTKQFEIDPNDKDFKSQEDLWRIFKVMSEFVEGFETMSKIKPSVLIFGSARTKSESEYYKLAVDVAVKLVEKGFGVTTGGGPGIMEAANMGANLAGGSSTGLNILLPYEQEANKYIDKDKLISFRYFFIRKVMMAKYAQGYILMPGGFGTIDECFEILTLIQTQKTDKLPVIFMGKKHWGGLLDWVKNTLLKGKFISEGDLGLYQLTDDAQEAADIICEFHSGKKFTTNF